MTTLFIGLSTLDIQYFVDEFPASNIKTKTEEPQLLIGGPATNAAVANSFLGDRSVLISGVGNGPFKSLFQKDFEECNIEHIDFYNGHNQLPVLASVITSKKNGDRNIFTYNPSVNGYKLNYSEIMDEIKPNQLLVDGFYPEIAVPFCKIAKENNIPIVFDGGSWKPHLTDLLPYIDYGICSANFFPPGCKTAYDIKSFLNNAGIKRIAITNGSEPVWFEDENCSAEIELTPVQAIDTLGAGDFFHGAFCFYNLNGLSFEDALGKASIVASKSCEYTGTRGWLNKLEKETFL